MALITGTSGDDTLTGQVDVADTLDGGVGNDTLQGGAGDLLLGGEGNDSLSHAVAFTSAVPGGSASDPRLYIYAATLDGGAGDDVLRASQSGSVLTGGSGADRFLFPTVTGGSWLGVAYPQPVNVVTDFNAAEGDRLDVTELDFNRFSPNGEGLLWRGAADNPNFSLQFGQAFSSNDYAAFGTGADQVWTWTSGGATWVIVDRDGSGTYTDSDPILKLQGVTSLDLGAFVSGAFGQYVNGTSGGDVMTGGDHADLLRGGDGADSLDGSGSSDVLFGEGGDDSIVGGAGPDRISGGTGADVISGGDNNDYISGDEGNDSITGGHGFDQINGNMGDDTARGGDGDDWVVGGKDNDLLYGDDGFDVVYGNLGNDTVYGGEGNDWVRGGQGDDVVDGGNGLDWIAGDRGNDTLTGGAGEDTFYIFTGAGIDRVTDFAYGDRVLLDPGQTYTLSYTSEGLVIDLGGGDQMILLGVTQATNLGGGWIIV